MATQDELKVVPRKVIYILDSFPGCVGGTENQFWALLRGLDRENIEPAVAVLRPSEFLQGHLDRVPYHCLNIERLRSPTALYRALKFSFYLKRSGYTICHLIFPDTSILFPIPLRLAGLRVVVWRRDLGKWYNAVNKPLLWLNSIFVDKYIANCKAVAESIQQGERVPFQKICVIYNGIVQSSKSNQGFDKATRSDCSRNDRISLLLISNLRPLKRVEDAIRALKLLVVQNRDATLTVIGEDRPGVASVSHLRELKKLAQDIGVLDRVEFLGGVKSAREYVPMYRFCLLCSETEGLSNALLEYLSAGRVIIATCVGGNQEVIVHGSTGYLYQVGDFQRLSELIAQAADDFEGSELIRERAKQSATENFSMHGMIKAHEQVYCSI